MFNWLKSVMTKATIWAKKLFSSGKEPPSRVDEPSISLNDLVESIAQKAKQITTTANQIVQKAKSIAYKGLQWVKSSVTFVFNAFLLRLARVSKRLMRGIVKSSEVKNTYRWLEGKPLGLVA